MAVKRSGSIFLVAWVCLWATGAARAFTLTDHAVKALIRPCKKIYEIEAESCPGLPAERIVEDELAANGKAARLTPGEPRLRLSRRLERGTYALWCIARSDGTPSRYREPMYVHLFVTGPSPSGSQRFRMRINYMESVYQDVSHLYFDVNEPGDYELAFGLGHDSRFGLLVDRIELRDVLAGTWKRGFKTAATLFTEPPHASQEDRSAVPAPYSRTEALELGRGIAGSLPPRNAILASGGMPTEGYYQEFRLSDAPLAEPNADRWVWKLATPLDEPWVFKGPTLPAKDEFDDLLSEDALKQTFAAPAAELPTAKSFGVAPESDPDINWASARPGPEGVYAVTNYQAFEKAPGRWPDDGGGFFIPEDLMAFGHNRYFNWMAVAFKGRICAFRQELCELADRYYETGNPRLGLRAALMLAFYADHFPSLDHTVQATMMATWGSHPFNCFAGNRAGEFGKIDYSGWAGANNVPVVHAYDKLFPLIKDNQDLADAIGQTIPWVRTPADVIELIDVKLVQHFFDVGSRGLVRFGPGLRCDPTVAVVQGRNEAGLAMLRKLVYESDYQFPGVLDAVVCRRSRDSTSFIGSMYYAKGPSMAAGLSIAEISGFAERLGLQGFDLTHPRRSMVLRQSAQWLIEPYATGIHIPGVGDVAGPQGYPTMTVGNADEAQRLLLAAWARYGDARFAWMLMHVYGLPAGTDEAVRARVAQAAAACPGDPRVNQPSRILGGFGVTILESNGAHPDFRRRTGVIMRTGHGAGHAHNDQLNLEIFSKGIVAAAEFGGRGGYGVPGTSDPRCLCRATVDGRAAPNGRTSLLADLPGMPCALGHGGPVTRFIALVDAGLDEAYVFDVVRAAGGKERAYWFHGNESDSVDFDATKAAATKLSLMQGADDTGDDLLRELAEEEKGDVFEWNRYIFSHSVKPEHKNRVAGDVYQAVWPLKREMEERILERVRQIYPFADGQRPEALYDPQAPRKFTRLILPASRGRRVQTLIATSEQVGYRITCAGISEQKPEQEQSVFPAVIEPFEGQAFVSGCRSLACTPAGAGRPCAVQVTVRKNRRDVFYQNDDPDARCRVAGDAGFEASALFACVSRDAQGPRACALVAGTTVAAEDIGLAAAQTHFEARIRDVDFIEQRIVLDRRLPATLRAPAYFEIGEEGTPFRIARLEHGDRATVLHFEKTAETFRAPLFLLHEGREVVGPIEPEHRQEKGWLTNEAHDRGWPVEAVRVGAFRWMGTSFRGGARMGGPISWDLVPDADGDGMRTLLIGPNDQWKEPMRVEVLKVDPELRVFSFRPLEAPEGYAGTRSYASSWIRNEEGAHISTSVIPGKMGSFVVGSEQPLRDADFTDADGDGSIRFHVYYFGPGDTVRIQAHAGLLREAEGAWLLTANTPVDATLPGPGRVQLLDADGKWAELPHAPAGDGVRVSLSEEQLARGQVRLRVR